MSDNKKFNPTLARGYNMSRGAWSPPITSEDYDSIMKNVEIGGRLVYKQNKAKKNDTSPDGYFEFIPASEVKAMEAARNARKGNSEDI